MIKLITCPLDFFRKATSGQRMGTNNKVCGYSADADELPTGVFPERCDRDVWKGGRCIWHADTQDKPLSELEKAIRQESGNRIDGAVLRNLELEDEISFEGFNLYCADFRESDLSEANFKDTNLYKAGFEDATLDYAYFNGDCKAEHSDFTEASLKNTKFNGTQLSNAIFERANCLSVECVDAKLMDADLKEATLCDGLFLQANLRKSNLSGADLRGTNCYRCNLERANLSDADLRDSILTFAKLDEADLRNVHADHRTNLGESEVSESNPVEISEEALEGTTLDQYELEESFEMENLNGICYYEAEADRKMEGVEWDKGYAGTGRNLIETVKFAIKRCWRRLGANESDDELERATHVYRDYQRVFQDNPLPQRQRLYAVREKHARRKYSLENNDVRSWIKFASFRFIFLYGEDPWRVPIASLAIVLLFSAFYPLFGIENASGTTVSQYVTSIDFSWDAVVTAIVFSFSQFMGGADFGYETTGFGRMVATAEVVVGALFTAIFVFALGRRATE